MEKQDKYSINQEVFPQTDVELLIPLGFIQPFTQREQYYSKY